MKKIQKFIVLIPALLLLTGCSFFSRGTGERIILAGSTSVQPYAEALAEAYHAKFPGVKINVQGGGSAVGFSSVETGTADIGMSSRDPKPGTNEAALNPKIIAKDSLVPVVHPKNRVDYLTRDQLRDIYTGKISNWKQVGGRDAEIHVITREEGSGTRSAFEEFVMRGQRINPRTLVMPANGTVRFAVANDVNAIGYISHGFADDEDNPVKILDWDEPLVRKFYLIFKEAPTEGIIKDFFEFVMSDEGQAILVKKGLISGVGVGE